MLLSMTMFYDEKKYKKQYPNLNEDELIMLMKEEFFDELTQMEWSVDLVNSIEVVED